VLIDTIHPLPALAPARPLRSDSAAAPGDQGRALAIAAAGILVGLLFVLVVRPGIPYDEPSHFNVVQTYAAFRGLPVIGRPGVTYEAYQPPLYYGLAGAVYRIASNVMSPRNSFYVVRIATLILFPPLIYLVFRITFEFTGNRPAATLAAVFVAVNPSLLAIASSVQNDTLAFLLATVTIYVCARWSRDASLSYSRAAVLGALIAATILTKSSALPLVGVVPLVILARFGRRSLPRVCVILCVMLLLSGWWFVRNIRLYGDWTGGRAVAATFDRGDRYHPASPRDWLRAARDLSTYYSLPVEYWRNDVKASLAGRSIVCLGIAWTAVGAGALALKRRIPISELRRDRLLKPFGVILLFSGACLAFWLLICIRNYVVAPRVSMPGLAGVAALVGFAAQSGTAVFLKRGRAVAGFAVMLLGMLGLDALMLVSVSRVPPQPYEIPLIDRKAQAEHVIARGRSDHVRNACASFVQGTGRRRTVAQIFPLESSKARAGNNKEKFCTTDDFS
jgi:hypothetical protein